MIHWFVDNVWPNLFASAVCVAIAWFWKVEPHLKKIHKHNEYMRLRTEQLHKELRNGKTIS